MSKETIEKIRIKLANEREEKFRGKLAGLLAEMEDAKRIDDFLVDEVLMPRAIAA